VGQPVRRQPAQLVVDQRQEPRRGTSGSPDWMASSSEVTSDMGHLRRKSPAVPPRRSGGRLAGESRRHDELGPRPPACPGDRAPLRASLHCRATSSA
jgi:hypothetical protein